MTAPVRAEGLRRTYGDTVALDGVDLSVREGEVFALLGPNGAGKTTLVRCLAGTLTPDDGRASLLGAAPPDADRERLGLLPQSYAPAERLTGRELVAYYAGLYDDPRDPDAVLDEVGVEARDTRYEDLSGGQRRRVCVAAAVVNDPDVLFLDEPTAGIDPAGRRRVRETVESLAAAGTTVLVTTHDVPEAEALADRVGLLADGRLVATGAPRDLVAEHAGASRLHVETAADPERVADALDAPVAADDAGLVVEDVGPGDIGDVVRVLDGAGVPFTGLRWREPDLEDAYLALADGAEVTG